MRAIKLTTALLSATMLFANTASAQGADLSIGASDCTATKIGASISPSLIGEPVSGVTLHTPVWHEASGDTPAYCEVTGAILPVDKSATARLINFAVGLPSRWNRIAIHMGGAGMNGSVPRVTGAGMVANGPAFLPQGMVAFGSDSGHSGNDNEWALNDEAIKNFGYMQMKKTRDAVMQIVQRAYAAKPRYTYWVGGSQGGREGLTVVQRYPADYDGVVIDVPVVNFTGLIFAPTWIQREQMSLANHLPATKGKAIATQFIRKCDQLDGIADGVINNYMACRALFSAELGAGKPDPWAEIRCPNDTDLNPTDASPAACLTAAQVRTARFIFSPYRYASPLANNNPSFGMWLPTTAVAGEGIAPPPGAVPNIPVAPVGPPGAGAGVPRLSGGLISDTRYRGQEGAATDAPVFASIGSVSLIGFVMGNLNANPLEYREGVTAVERRRQIAEWFDATNPDLSAFRKRGGKLIIIIGTNDTLASSGSQVDYYQSVLDRMGQATVDSFARFYVLPQTGHVLTGSSYTVDGNGKTIPASEIPSGFNRVQLLRDWVEKGVAPGRSTTVTGATGSRPMCSYPEYPRYVGGDASQAGSYRCTKP